MSLSKYVKSIIFYILLFTVIMVIFTLYNDFNRKTARFIYSDLYAYIKSGTVQELVIVERQAMAKLDTGETIEVIIPPIDVLYMDLGADLQVLMDAGKIKFDPQPAPPTPWWVSILPTLIIIVFFVVFWVFFLQQSQGGGGKVMSFAKSRAKVVPDSSKKVTFADVAGAEEEKEELAEVVDFLKFPKKYIELGARIPRGILLVGPPGTGKTYFAKAVSGEAGVPFFSISGSDFVEMFVGVGASRVRDLFDQAKKNSPSIVFIDEIDAVGRHRGAGLGGGHDEREQTLNQLLVEMDGFGANEGVIIIAATNRPDILDPALLRPGRFDRQIFVGAPDVRGREGILKIHTRQKPLAPDVDLGVIARTTAGFKGADLENLTNEAALLSARRDAKEIGMNEFKEAIIKVIAGPAKKAKIITDKEKRVTAYHEAGHAIVTHLLESQDDVHQVSIIPRGRMGGYTMSLPTEDRQYECKMEMMDDISVLLAGRVAEKLVLDDISSGASNDIERATTIARNMVVKYGMSDELGPIMFGTGNDEPFVGRDYSHMRNYSEEVAGKIDDEIREIISTSYEKCTDILRMHMEKLHEVASALLDRETLEGNELKAIFDGTFGVTGDVAGLEG